MTTFPTKKPAATKYLSNVEILKEIHKSKITYSYYVDPKYHQYDAITDTVDAITPEFLEEARTEKARVLTRTLRADARLRGETKTQVDKIKCVDPDTIDFEDVVIRVMTHEHIPLEAGRVKKPKTVADNHVRLFFPPYKHYIMKDGQLVEVGRSHWRHALDNGEFCQTHGKMTDKLGVMFMLLVERYGRRFNWRGYSFIEEMKGQALVQLSMVGLQFNEARSANPFAYFTVTCQNAFTKVLNAEKVTYDIRDDLLEMNGFAPSMTRQVKNEAAAAAELEAHNSGIK